MSVRVVPLSLRRHYRPAEGKVVLPDVLGEEEGPQVTSGGDGAVGDEVIPANRLFERNRVECRAPRH